MQALLQMRTPPHSSGARAGPPGCPTSPSASSWRWCLIGEQAQQPWTPGGQPIDLLTACAGIQTDCHLVSNSSQDTPDAASVLPPLQDRHRIVVMGYGARVYAHADISLVRILASIGDVIATCHRLWSTGSATGTSHLLVCRIVGAGKLANTSTAAKVTAALALAYQWCICHRSSRAVRGGHEHTQLGRWGREVTAVWRARGADDG